MESKLISVIIPAYNAQNYLAEALASVFAQEYRPLEVIVVDDGSTDQTAAVAKCRAGVRYLYQEHQGPMIAKNNALAHCRGELIAFLDADDLWLPGKLSRQVAYLGENPELGCVLSRMRNFLEEGVTCPPWVDPAIFSENWVANNLGTVLCHRWVVDQVGGFNPAYHHADVVDWFLRLSESNIKIASMPDVLLRRRIHLHNMSQDRAAAARERVRALKASMDRRRAHGSCTPACAAPGACAATGSSRPVRRLPTLPDRTDTLMADPDGINAD